jgi:hypothetical protein
LVTSFAFMAAGAAFWKILDDILKRTKK